jgi:hypothetical protein
VGLLLQGGTVGTIVEALVFGTVADLAFAGFATNAALFLQTNSFLSDAIPSSIYSVLCGKYLGNNTIFVNINEPIKL